jgi:BirA family biotin operon repressor/biotin-[acetyl-CoA-carboxylase] ligase
MFNIEEFDIKLDTEFVGRNFVYCHEIDSTNSFLMDSTDFDKDGTVLLAEYQSKGKGRKKRNWRSNKEQNLTFSILFKRNFKQESLNILNLSASLAVAVSIKKLFQLKAELKWPNDVLINRKKAAGILLESSSKGKKIDKAVVGIGINVNQPTFSGDFNITPTSIKKEFKKDINRERLLSEILNNFEEIYLTGLGNSAKVLSDWKSRCKMLGEKVKVIENDNIQYGIFEDIDDHGFLLLKVGSKIEKIHFGDVSLI